MQAKNPPEPDGSESAMEVLDSKIFVDDTELMMDADHLFDELERVSGIIKEYEDEKDRIKQQIIARMGNKARGQAQGWTATYLPQERTTIDRARLLKLYERDRAEAEEPSSFFARVTAESVNAVLGDLAELDANTADDVFLDIGEDRGFKVSIGAGECEA